jgi:hypothetical protein
MALSLGERDRRKAVVRIIPDRECVMNEVKPHPANVPGDYFVEDGCCMSCDVPIDNAPDLFGWVHDSLGQHCYVRKQPETTDEQEQMFAAIRHAEAGCIMYCGHDRAIQERLIEAGEGPICIGLPDDLQRRSEEVLAELFPQRQRPPSRLYGRLMRWGRGTHA